MTEELKVDLDRNFLIYRDKILSLRPLHAEIMSVLVDNVGNVVRFETLIQKGWGYGDPPLCVLGSLRVQICHLRQHLRFLDAPFKIFNYREIGYELVRENSGETVPSWLKIRFR